MVNEQRWYQLDGSWHSSVATRLSALHLPSLDPNTEGCSLCAPMTTVLYMSDGYTEKEAADTGRTLCKKCVARSSSTTTKGKP